ncbi:MAG: class I SAM-dependent methyltransferase, partial [Pseudomonadota bacterium]
MSYTTLDHMPEPDIDRIEASSSTLRALTGVPASFRIAAMMLLRARKGQIRFRLPNGRLLVFNHGIDGPRAEVIVHKYDFARRAMGGGDIGFAESYMDGEWSTPDLTSVLRYFAVNFEAAGQLAVGGKLVRALNKVRHAFNRNSKTGSRRNIEAHYDLGNEFYSTWLDSTMTYSSAIFEQEGQTLEQAQHSKYKKIADTLNLQPDQHVLEIGCGWGGFAEHVATENQA